MIRKIGIILGVVRPEKKVCIKSASISEKSPHSISVVSRGLVITMKRIYGLIFPSSRSCVNYTD